MTDPSNPDVLIVGAGPSGSVTAALLARRGWSVQLVDRASFPRGKACGEFVNPGAVAALSRLGLLSRELRRAGAAVGHWEIGARRRAVGTFPRSAPSGMGISRSVLDTALAQEAQRAGAEFQTRTSLAGFEVLSSGPEAHLRRDGERWTVRPTVLVGAGGLRCPIAAHIGEPQGTDRTAASMTFHLSTHEGVPVVPGAQASRARMPGAGVLRLMGERTIGSVPLNPEGTEWNVTVVSTSPADKTRISKNAPQFLAEIVQELGGGPYSVKEGPWGSGQFDRPMRKAFHDRVVLVGDAAGYFDPFTGQGIYQAVRSGELAAEAIQTVLHGTGQPNGAFGRYQAALQRERKKTRALQRSVDWVLRPGSRRSFSMATIQAVPWILNQVLARTGDTTHEQGHQV